MSAPSLQAAVGSMRDEHGPGHPRHEFWSTLARWLEIQHESTCTAIQQVWGPGGTCEDEEGPLTPESWAAHYEFMMKGALGIARAYLARAS